MARKRKFKARNLEAAQSSDKPDEELRSPAAKKQNETKALNDKPDNPAPAELKQEPDVAKETAPNRNIESDREKILRESIINSTTLNDSQVTLEKRLIALNKQLKARKKDAIKDPRLIPRIREYLSSKTKSKNFVSIPQMTEYLQNKYPEYGRKKRSAFEQYVDKAYAVIMETPPIGVPKVVNPLASSWPQCEDEEEEGVADDDDDVSTDDDIDETVEGDKDGDWVDYKDIVQSNSMNNMMSNMYRSSPVPKTTIVHDNSKPSKVLYPSPNVLDRNPNSTGLTGPRRSSLDKYFIDRKGDNQEQEKTEIEQTVVTREGTIERFLGSLPSRTSFSSFVNVKKDPRVKSGSLYKVHTVTGSTKTDEISHSGITSENTGVTQDAPESPKSAREEKNEETQVKKKNVQDIPMIEQDPLPKTQESKNSSRTPRKVKKKVSKSRTTEDSEDESIKKEKGPQVQKSTVTFADVGGNEKNLTEICKLLVHMRHPEVYQQLGVTPPRGFLLHGPPGCGKTLLANAIAGELDLPLLKIAAPEIVSGVSGDSEEKIRELFDKATKTAPCVVFIDEIDSITPKRETASKDMERRIVAQLLSCMDDLNSSTEGHVLVIGATNRPDAIDPALRRAGRFDREICLGIPDQQSRFRILQVLCRTLRLSHDFDFDYLAHNTPGYVGADLMALTREAAMTAVNRVFQTLQSQPCLPVEGDTESDKIQSEVKTNDNVNIVNTSVCVNDFDTDKACQNMDIDTTSDKTPGSQQNLLTWTTHSTVDTEKVIETLGINGEKQTNGTDSDNKNEDKTIEKVNNTFIATCNSIENSDTQNGVNGPQLLENGVIGAEYLKLDTKTVSTEQLTDTSVAADIDTVTIETEPGSDAMEISVGQDKSNQGQESELQSVLSWLKEHPPLTEEQLKDLYITMEDFKDALQYVQPSAKREGFATIPDVTWDDIGALHDVREELQLAILAPVRHATEFKSLGLSRAQGILLAGPPGCGKTLLAKAVANESGINFISVKGPELLNMYVGESERAVRTVFQRARNSSPCVIFFDELDALCPRRSGHNEGGSARVVNQLLTEMDGYEERNQVFIMAATNRPDIIDPAVLRPGRLDKTLYVGLPTLSDRLDIFKCITKNGTQPKLADDVDLTTIAGDQRCEGYTGADLAALVREASVTALKEAILNKGRQPTDVISVKGHHFDTAFRKIKPSVSMKDQEKYKSMGGKLSTE